MGLAFTTIGINVHIFEKVCLFFQLRKMHILYVALAVKVGRSGGMEKYFAGFTISHV
jgi:hypothetical protein